MNLESIDLSDNKIYNIQIGAFGELKSLTKLNLEKNRCVNQEFEDDQLLDVEGALEKCHVALTTTAPPMEGACLIPDIPNGRIYAMEDDILNEVPEIVGSFYEDFDPVQVNCFDEFYSPQKADSWFK